VNLNELVLQLRKPPVEGAYEIVRGPDAMNHLAVITRARDVRERGINVREFAFQLWCGLVHTDPTTLEVVRTESLTCIRCVQWRTS